MIHALKIDPIFFAAVADGRKKFEVRKDDRGFQTGDYLALNELDDTREQYTRRSILARVTYILDDEMYCKNGYVIMGIEPVMIPTDGQSKNSAHASEKIM